MVVPFKEASVDLNLLRVKPGQYIGLLVRKLDTTFLKITRYIFKIATFEIKYSMYCNILI